MQLDRVKMFDSEGFFCHSLRIHKNGYGFWYDHIWHPCYIKTIELYIIKHDQNRTYIEKIGYITRPRDGTIENVERIEIHKDGLLKLYIQVKI